MNIFFSSNDCCFIYEGNHLGGCFRFDPDIDLKTSNSFLIASNHFIKYGVHPNYRNKYQFDIHSLGIESSSIWRYYAGYSLAENWKSIHQPINIEEIKKCLQVNI